MSPVWDILLYLVLPLWVLAGFADYLCHRAGDIEHANGVRENLLHWLMMAELGVPAVLVAFFRVDALLVGVMIAALIAHEITTHFDLRLAMRTRIVTPFEQQIHSVMEMMPFAAFLLLCILNWPQAQALFGAGAQPADFRLVFQPMPLPGVAIFFGALLALNAVPYIDETVRGLKAHKHQPPQTKKADA